MNDIKIIHLLFEWKCQQILTKCSHYKLTIQTLSQILVVSKCMFCGLTSLFSVYVNCFQPLHEVFREGRLF